MNNLSNERASDKDIQQIIDSKEKGTAMFMPVDVYYLIAKELKALREAGKEPVAETMFKPVADLFLFKAPGCRWWSITEDAESISEMVRSGWPVREYVTLERFQQSYAAPQLTAVPDDTRRMDWLCSMVVDVREPLVYGSHSVFWSQRFSDDDEPHRTTLREQIDAAIAAAPKP